MNERLQKLLSQAGIASRREAENIIKAGRVKVNGKVAQLGDKASFKDQILVDSKPIAREEKVYFVLNKPKNTICTLKDNFDRTLVTDLIDTPYKIFPVGRLDYDTTGVLLLTNDGDLSNKLTHPRYEIIRRYRVRLNTPLSDKELKLINQPVPVNGTESIQSVYKLDTKSYLVSLTVGTYHHVKELFNYFDKTVVSLKRVEYAGITVEKIPEGEYRRLTIKEVKMLKLLTRTQDEKLKKKMN
ncbi:pseudouridine synthase [Mycoplasmopsis pullorum]|uniref:Pseudouridine synthase n=1 Tax=Mycoplasmopsis pullorum TaxID=48003 RepID=A0A1L4FSD5_9BACT|nr:pseudouridine synthase [Mycoplasmopsis pullorum]APJ38523.1 pseudouridine synthase [Mycoplasmopsis pullorum]